MSSTRPEPHKVHVVEETPRYLHRDSSHGYTSASYMAMRSDPGQALSEEDQRVVSLRARTEFAEARAEQTKRADRKAWLERLRKVEMRADSKSIDVYKHIVAIRREVLAMERLVEDAA